MSQMLGEQEVKEAVEGISYGAHQMRDGVSLNEQKQFKPVVSANDIMNLDDLEAYIKLPGNLPITKIKFEIPSSELICPDFIPIQDYKPPKTNVLEASVTETCLSETHMSETHVSKETIPSALESEQQIVAKNSRREEKTKNPRSNDLKPT